MIFKLLTEHHLDFLSLKGGCRGSSESTHAKMPHCWKSHALVQLLYLKDHYLILLNFDNLNHLSSSSESDQISNNITEGFYKD